MFLSINGQVAVTPSEEELKKRLAHHNKLRGVENVSVDRSIYRKQMEAIMENAKSDRPIWDVKFPTK